MKTQKQMLPAPFPYPLRIVEDQVNYDLPMFLKPSLHFNEEIHKPPKKIDAADPRNWDVGWFSSYE